MSKVSLDSKEIKDLFQHVIANNRSLQENGLMPVAIEVIGPAGLGKTTSIKQIAQEHNLELVKISLSQIEDLGDLVGFPLRQFEMVKGGGSQPAMKTIKKMVLEGGVKKLKEVQVPSGEVSQGGSKEWVDENATAQFAQQGYSFTGNKRMSYCPPEWITDKKGGGILLLDDWTRANPRFLQACMELIDQQEYISWKLPKDWHIALSSNPDDGNYMVNTIDVAQKTRFISVEMKFSEERWAEWAEAEGIDGRCINFLLMNPEVVTDEVNPRALTTFFRSISSIKDFEKELGLIQMLGEGSVGGSVATMFTTFINNRLDKLVSPKEMFIQGSHEDAVAKIMEAVKPEGDYRADIGSVLTTRLINFAISYSEKNPISEKNLERLDTLIKHPEAFTDDLKYHIVKKIINGNKQKFQKLLFDSEIQAIAVK